MVSSPETVASRWYVRALTGGNALHDLLGGGELLSRPEEREAACITGKALTRSELDRCLAGLEPLSVLRVLD